MTGSDTAAQVNTTGLENALMAFFMGHGSFRWTGLEKLPDLYQWPSSGKQIPWDRLRDIGIHPNDGKSLYEQNVDLKLRLSEIWKDAGTDLRFEIARWIIRDWGGIHRTGDDTINLIVREAGMRKACVGVIASSSKVLATAWPKKFCIYDSRVSVAVKAVQLLANTPPMVAFAFVRGRGRLTRKGSGFSSKSEFREVFGRDEHRWQYVHEFDSYCLYNRVMRRLAGDLSRPLYDLEMLLFAEAENLAGRCEHIRKA